MASTAQVLKNTPRSYVIKIEGDAAETITIDAADVDTALPEDGTATLKRARWTQASGDIVVAWAGGTPATAIRMGGNGSWNLIQNPPAISNNATAPTGNITITKGTAAAYTVILEFGS